MGNLNRGGEMQKIQLLNIDKAYGTDKPVIENLNLKIQDGSFTVLLGPSGCGKSTTLRMIAGLEKVTGGDILIDGKNVNNVEPGDRNIAMVFQNYALYPTMSVRENMEFGLKNKKIEKAEINKRVSEISSIVGLTEYLDRKPQSLSGGQRQRVALARAMVKNPAVFLMDEPLSNLDAQLRSQIRTDLIELHNRLKTTFIYVTHDQVEAMSMGTDIVLMKDGQIMQHGTPEDIYYNPTNVFTAEFIGTPPMNILEANKFDDISGMPQNAQFVGFRPEDAKILNLNENSSDEFISFVGSIVIDEMLGSESLYKLDTNKGRINVKLYKRIHANGEYVNVSVPKDKLYYFDKDQQRIFS